MIRSVLYSTSHMRLLTHARTRTLSHFHPIKQMNVTAKSSAELVAYMYVHWSYCVRLGKQLALTPCSNGLEKSRGSGKLLAHTPCSIAARCTRSHHCGGRGSLGPSGCAARTSATALDRCALVASTRLAMRLNGPPVTSVTRPPASSTTSMPAAQSHGPPKPTCGKGPAEDQGPTSRWVAVLSTPAQCQQHQRAAVPGPAKPLSREGSGQQDVCMREYGRAGWAEAPGAANQLCGCPHNLWCLATAHRCFPWLHVHHRYPLCIDRLQSGDSTGTANAARSTIHEQPRQHFSLQWASLGLLMHRYACLAYNSRRTAPHASATRTSRRACTCHMRRCRGQTCRTSTAQTAWAGLQASLREDEKRRIHLRGSAMCQVASAHLKHGVCPPARDAAEVERARAQGPHGAHLPPGSIQPHDTQYLQTGRRQDTGT